MSTISSVSSTPNPYPTADQKGLAQIVKVFNSIGSALQSGNMTAAQTALSTFQADLPGNSQTQTNELFGKNSQANTDYQSLVSAVQSGNLSSAQQAFASLQSNLSPASTSARGHKGHHHRGSGGGSADSLLNSLATSPPATSTNSGNTSAPASATNGTAASAPTASTDGFSLSFSESIEVVEIGLTLNVTA